MSVTPKSDFVHRPSASAMERTARSAKPYPPQVSFFDARPGSIYHPIWSRDGKYVYFSDPLQPGTPFYRLHVANRKLEQVSTEDFPAGLYYGFSGFFKVWAIHFDPSQGRVIGVPSEVTKFNSPARMMPEHVPSVDLSVTQNNLLLTLEQRSGSIWALDNVDH